MTDARHEPRLPVLTGRAWSFSDDLAATDILPSRFAVLAPPDAAQRLFADLDSTLARRLGAGDVLVAGQNLGRGPGGEPAARAAARVGAVAGAALAAAIPPACSAAPPPPAGLPPPGGTPPPTSPRGARMRHTPEPATTPTPPREARNPTPTFDEPLLARLR